MDEQQTDVSLLHFDEFIEKIPKQALPFGNEKTSKPALLLGKALSKSP
jgi:hypothetical protein